MLDATLSLILIEDNPELCRGWRDLFDLDGHRVEAFQSGAEALRHLASVEVCDCLISDYYLPDINGVELIAKLRARRPQLPAILLTGSKEPSIAEAVQELGHVLLLYKPLGIDKLEDGIRRMVGARGGLKGAAPAGQEG